MKTKQFEKYNDAKEFANKNNGFIESFVDENINWTYIVFCK